MMCQDARCLAHRLAAAVAELPDTAAITLTVGELRACFEASSEQVKGPDASGPVAPDWGTLFWEVPAERRIGVPELAEALGRNPDFVYKRTTARAKNRIPHRRFGGELEFVVGEVRQWLKDTEQVVVRGASDRRTLRAS